MKKTKGGLFVKHRV